MTVPCTVHLKPRVARAVEIAAERTGRSVSAFCRDALHRHVYGSAAVPESAPDPSAFTYVIRCGDFYKIGRARDVAKRVKFLALPEAEVVATVKDASLERALHVRYGSKRVRGEWFRLQRQDVEEIKKIFSKA